MTAYASEAFKAWCAFLDPTEGGLSLDPRDPGNWTSGKPGIGVLKGTKYGISASAYPALDIASLTLDQADDLRKKDYWDKISGDLIHPSIAFVLAEAAYGSGPITAVKEMEGILGTAEDGILGPNDREAMNRMRLDDILVNYSARRIVFESHLRIWSDYDTGWSRRLFKGLIVALSLA